MAGLTFVEAVRRLQSEAGTAPPPCSPAQLSLKEITTAVAAFQPRDIDSAFLATDGHIKTLAEAVKESGAAAFEPLTVWWSGQRWYIIDGHHRLNAYHEVNKNSKHLIEAVPVTVFEGSLAEAVRESAALNSKDKLPMQKADKLERAWKLVCLDKAMTGKHIREATTISLRTIATMRKERDEILLAGENPLEWMWTDAKNRAGPVIRDDDWLEQEAIEWQKRLVKTFGKKFVEQPEIAARALELYAARLPLELVRHWPEAAEKLREEQAEDERESEF